MPWGVRRDNLTSSEEQSPGKNVARSIGVCVVFVAARLAPEHRLALAVTGRRVAADVALLRGEARVDLDDGDAGRCRFLFHAHG
jgi:hypothetical protein